MSENALIPSGSNFAIMPVMDIQAATNRRQALIEYTRQLMVPGRDFGKIPGTGDKPTLLKPGAEKLCSLFGLSPVFDLATTDMDWMGERHGGEPFFYLQYRCRLLRGEMVVGEGVGSCNSWEKKYRYRQAERVCPVCGKSAIIKGKAEYGGGWLCFKKKDGCGAKFPDGDHSIEGQEAGQVKNPDPSDIVNTIDKMAQKRALIAATLIAVNASEFYTQDVEDYADVIEGSYTEAPSVQVQTATEATRPIASTNGQAAVTSTEVKYCANGDIIRNGALKAFNAYVAENGHTPDSADELRAWAAHFKAEQAAREAASVKQDDLFGEGVTSEQAHWEDPA